MNVEEIRKLAHEKISGLSYKILSKPLETVKTIKFDIPRGQSVDQAIISAQNLELDQASCLGRVAQSAAVIEKHFKETDLTLAEVWEDNLRNIMLAKLDANESLVYDPTFMDELLMYEDPHTVILVDGVQFDPLSLELGFNIEHPRIKSFPLWESIVSSVLVSRAWLENDPSKKLEILETAESICPGLTLVKENIVSAYILLDETDKAIEAVKWCHEKRPCARMIYVLYLLTNERIYHDQLTKTYTKEIIQYF